MTSCGALAEALSRRIAAGHATSILVLRLPEFSRVAWRAGKRAAQRLERTTAAAFREAAHRIVREGDALFHEAGSDWFAVGMFAPSRAGALNTALDARSALERIAAAMTLRTGHLMETGWWVISTPEEIDDIDGTIGRALERGARERERFEFLSTVGHELRTPLTSIRGYIETLLDGGVDTATSRKFLETARRETLRLGRLVDGMLEFSLLDLGPIDRNARATNLSQLVGAAIDALAPVARERKVSIDADVPRDLFARIDPDACMHAILNLVENATKYGKPGGSVLVSAASDPPDAVLAVDDDGPGVAPAERETVFALRSRGGSVDVPGSGIGLAIVKAIVERARGTVSIHDSALGGARFVVRLPADAPIRAESAAFLS
jgi:signal transduction histidine kinase